MSGILSVGGGGNVGAAGGFYPYSIDQSLRFSDNDGPNLTQTYGGSPTSTALGTFSWWMKLGNVPSKSQENIYFESAGAGGIQLRSGKLASNGFDSSNTQVIVETDALLRDPLSWYHCIVSVNGTAGTITFYINGVEQAQTVSIGSLVAGRSWDMLGYDSKTSFVISNSNSSYSFDGYLAEFHYIDGQALDATSFGETINGIWVPKAYSGSYGTNGWYLSFADSAAIGDDLSGNTNDWTANNLAASDVVPDSPTNNFATLNPLYKDLHQNILSQGNLQNDATSNYFGTGATIAVKTGKWYCEVNMVARSGLSNIGIDDVGGTLQKEAGYGFAVTSGNYGVALLGNDGKIQNNAVDSQTGLGALSTGDIIGMALDLDSATKTIQFYKNNVAYGTAETISASAPTGEFVFGSSGHNASTHVINFGQDSTFAGNETAGGNADDNGIGDFFYAPPSGFLALCSANLPEPAIGPNSDTTSDEHFNTVLYTGTGAAQSITGANHAPDFTWIKCRSNARDNALYDTVRGATNRLKSNTTDAEDVTATALTSFDADGFSLGAGSTVNASGNTFVAWSWKAGGTAVSNTDGDITSQVSAAPDAGFSIVSYEGTGANATVGHGLSSAPELIIIRERDNSNGWAVSIKGDPTDFLRLDQTGDRSDDAAVFNDTAPTSTVFSIGTAAMVNRDSMIAYCFHSVDGFSKVGSYVGNASADGPFVFCNFRPAFLLTKMTTNSSQWTIIDNTRNTYNAVDKGLVANTSATEVTGSSSATPFVDFVSNGFKIRSSQAQMNQSGDTFIYLAFAEAPFKYSLAR